MKMLLVCCGALAGAAMVAAGCELTFMSWAVDWSGWLVGHFTSLDFHEGDGALGLALSLALSWIAWSLAAVGAVWMSLRLRGRKAQR